MSRRRLAVAQGQMNEDRLEKIIDGSWAREWDVLVCTTIVETGLGISNANTLVVDHAEVLSLSQMATDSYSRFSAHHYPACARLA